MRAVTVLPGGAVRVMKYFLFRARTVISTFITGSLMEVMIAS